MTSKEIAYVSSILCQCLDHVNEEIQEQIRKAIIIIEKQQRGKVWKKQSKLR